MFRLLKKLNFKFLPIDFILSRDFANSTMDRNRKAHMFNMLRKTSFRRTVLLSIPLPIRSGVLPVVELRVEASKKFYYADSQLISYY